MDRETEQHAGPSLPEGLATPRQRRCSPLDIPLQRTAGARVDRLPLVRDEARSAILHATPG
jgi:hypothetical protein